MGSSGQLLESELPLFSIVIPTYSRPKQLASCLQALTRLDYPRERFEVIVVDDGSKTPLQGVVSPFRGQLDLLLVEQVKAGPGAARNTGAARAQGKFLAFTDDDCIPAPNWLKNLALAFTALPDRIIGGRVLDALPSNLYSAASQLMHDAVYDYYNADPNQANFLASNNLALPTERFLAIGGFDTTFPLAAGEDNDLCNRWLHQGYRMTYDPEVVVYHAHALTLRSFCKQHFNRGRAAFHYRQMHFRRGWERVKADPNFYLHLFRNPLLQADGPRALLLELVLLVSHVAKTTGFLWEKTNRSDQG